MDIKAYLKKMVKQGASDLYFITGAPPCIKIHGTVSSLGTNILTADTVKEAAYNIMSPEQLMAFERSPEMNLSFAEKKIGRFRVNIYRQRNEVAMVFRHIKTKIPEMAELGLPAILNSLIMKKRGLILFVGATGVGKSTSLAAMINYRNQNSAGHIVTIEDPLEFIHTHRKSLVTQREVGVDTDSYEDALKNALRQAPDVIQIGEIRDQDTMNHALAFSETGHLCLSTLHANNANQAFERILLFFPRDRREQLLLDLSLNLVAVVSQRLVPSLDGTRAPCFEVLLGTPLICDLIKRNEITAIKEVMQKSEASGMQTFDNSLLKLYETGKISFEEALNNADSENNLRLAISLKHKIATGDTPNLSIMEEQRGQMEILQPRHLKPPPDLI